MPLALSNSALMILEPMSIPSPVSVKCRYVIRIHVTKCDRTNRKPEFSEISWSQNLASTWSVLIAKYNQRWSRLLIRTKQTIIPFDEISGPIPRIWQCFTVLLRLMTILDIEDSLCSTLRLVGQFFYYQARYWNSETIFVRMSAPEMSEMVPGLLKKDSERLAGREIKTT